MTPYEIIEKFYDETSAAGLPKFSDEDLEFIALAAIHQAFSNPKKLGDAFLAAHFYLQRHNKETILTE